MIVGLPDPIQKKLRKYASLEYKVDTQIQCRCVTSFFQISFRILSMIEKATSTIQKTKQIIKLFTFLHTHSSYTMKNKSINTTSKIKFISIVMKKCRDILLEFEDILQNTSMNAPRHSYKTRHQKIRVNDVPIYKSLKKIEPTLYKLNYTVYITYSDFLRKITTSAAKAS